MQNFYACFPRNQGIKIIEICFIILCNKYHRIGYSLQGIKVYSNSGVFYKKLNLFICSVKTKMDASFFSKFDSIIQKMINDFLTNFRIRIDEIIIRLFRDFQE